MCWVLKQRGSRHWGVAWFDQQSDYISFLFFLFNTPPPPFLKPGYITVQSVQPGILGISCFLGTSCSCSVLTWNSIFIGQTELRGKHAIWSLLPLRGACCWEYKVVFDNRLIKGKQREERVERNWIPTLRLDPGARPHLWPSGDVSQCILFF